MMCVKYLRMSVYYAMCLESVSYKSCDQLSKAKTDSYPLVPEIDAELVVLRTKKAWPKKYPRA